jgi:hypothetical protein
VAVAVEDSKVRRVQSKLRETTTTEEPLLSIVMTGRHCIACG